MTAPICNPTPTLSVTALSPQAARLSTPSPAGAARRALAWVVAGACGGTLMLGLSACGRDEPPVQRDVALTQPSEPAASTPEGVASMRESIPGAVLDPSVPAASAVFGAASAAAGVGSPVTNASPGESQGQNTQAHPKSLSATEEAVAMPLPGQANSHSTPATPTAPGAPASR